MAIVPGTMPFVQQNIDQHGQHLFGVFGGDDVPFLYTIGNVCKGLPELLLIGRFDPTVAGQIVNALGAKMREQGTPLEGDVSLGGKFPVRVRKASKLACMKYTVQVGQYLGHERYDVLQLLLCNPQGRYPGEPGCDPVFDVPLA